MARYKFYIVLYCIVLYCMVSKVSCGLSVGLGARPGTRHLPCRCC